ncbi:hypothetical protein RJ639_038309 [Escallonia herrerae]|uniref:Uncharacterized protein n=1 Tax=Escallonia herrerae TaxID=1293975 RepID=A0AA88WST1_9ASTE|nr:hypothetical protein RJ639_038309 [Escallonia herrerae]
MSYFHRFRNKFHCPVVNVEHLWSLVPQEAREKVAGSGATPVVDVMHRKAESQQTSKPFPSSPIYLVQLLSLFVTVLSILPLPIVLLQLLLLSFLHVVFLSPAAFVRHETACRPPVLPSRLWVRSDSSDLQHVGPSEQNWPSGNSRKHVLGVKRNAD